MTAKLLETPHKYDDPELSAFDFLLCIMHDQTLPLALRADAAGKLLPVYREVKIQTVRITGGLDLSPAELAQLEASKLKMIF
jgi:hypothetical protein